MSREPAPSVAAFVSRHIALWILGLSVAFMSVLISLFVWLQLREVHRENLGLSSIFVHHIHGYVLHAANTLELLNKLVTILPPKELPRAMQTLVDNTPQLDRLVIIDSRNEVVASAPPSLMGIDVPSRAIHKPKGLTINSRPMISSVTGKLMIFMEIPGDHSDVIGGELRLRDLQGLLTGFLPDAPGRLVSLSDKYGNIIAHSNPSMVRKQGNIGGLSILAKTREGQFGADHFMDGDTLYLGATAEVPSTGWVLLMALPALDVYLPIAQALAILAAVSLILMALIVWVLRLTVQKTLAKPMSGLTAAIRSVAARTGGDRPEGMDAVAEFAAIADEVELMGRTIRNREEALREAEQQYRSIFESIPDGFFRASLTGNILISNPEGARMLGYDSPEELIGKNLAADLFADPEQMRDFTDKIMTYGRVRGYQATIRRRDGTTFETESNVLLVRDPKTGEPQDMEGIFRDVTERKRVQQMLVQTEKMMSLGGLAAGMAHEINNPLAGISQGLQNLQRRLASDLPANRRAAEALGLDMGRLTAYAEQRGISDIILGIRESVTRAAAIVTNMLNFSRRSDGGTALQDLAAIADSAVTLAANDYNKKAGYDFKSIRIVRDYAPGLPHVFCIRNEIEQVVFNLLKNAAQSMAGGDPGRTREITLTTRREGGFAVLKVADNGPGVPPEIQSRVFEPFFTTKPPGVGTGLGLSVSYFIIVHNHNGTINVASGPKGGAVFTIRLPLVRSTS